MYLRMNPPKMGICFLFLVIVFPYLFLHCVNYNCDGTIIGCNENIIVSSLTVRLSVSLRYVIFVDFFLFNFLSLNFNVYLAFTHVTLRNCTTE